MIDDAMCPLPPHGTPESTHIPNAHICLKGPDGTHSHLHICDRHAEFVESLGPRWKAVDLRKAVVVTRPPDCQMERR